jgi:RNA polymerase sigma-70 factor (ECF subfamily)
MASSIVDRVMLPKNEPKTSWLIAAVERYEAPLVRYATAIVGDPDRARDVVQDTFLRLCREKQSRIGGYLAQWLFTVCRNRSMDLRRKGRREAEWTGGSLAPDCLTTPPTAVLEDQEMLNQILQLVELLPENQREVLILKFRCDLSYNEISHVTGLSVTNVGFLVHTGLKTVRSKLERVRQQHHTIRRVR